MEQKLDEILNRLDRAERKTGHQLLAEALEEDHAKRVTAKHKEVAKYLGISLEELEELGYLEIRRAQLDMEQHKLEEGRQELADNLEAINRDRAKVGTNYMGQDID